jgi:hypothetical protein
MDTVDRHRAEFIEFGPVERVVWPDDREYAYVEFGNVYETRKAFAVRNGCLLGRGRLLLDFIVVGLIDSKLN